MMKRTLMIAVLAAVSYCSASAQIHNVAEMNADCAPDLTVGAIQ
jgi:hypothetical protein